MSALAHQIKAVNRPAAHARAIDANDDDPMHRLLRFVSSKSTGADVEWIGCALKTWLHSHAEIPIERCLRLPSTPEKFRIMQRNQALCEAIQLLPEKDLWTASLRLEREWSEFITRGPWRIWRGDPEPPQDASPLNKALFRATTHNRSTSTGAKQISRICGHVFR